MLIFSYSSTILVYDVPINLLVPLVIVIGRSVLLRTVKQGTLNLLDFHIFSKSQNYLICAEFLGVVA